MSNAPIVYDTEIKRAIPDHRVPRDPALVYCNGWTDFKGMGISLITAVDLATGIPRVFLEDNFGEFARWSAGRILCGHTSSTFDDPLLQAHGLWTAARGYDMLAELRVACGEPRAYTRGVTKGGRTVNDCCRVNLNGLQKSADGAQAPALFQRGLMGELVDYGLRDVMLEYQLLLRRGSFVDPATGRVVVLPEPV